MVTETGYLRENYIIFCDVDVFGVICGTAGFCNLFEETAFSPIIFYR